MFKYTEESRLDIEINTRKRVEARLLLSLEEIELWEAKCELLSRQSSECSCGDNINRNSVDSNPSNHELENARRDLIAIKSSEAYIIGKWLINTAKRVFPLNVLLRIKKFAKKLTR